MTLLLVFVGSLFTIFALWLTIAPFIGADRGLRLEHLDEEVREIEQLVARRQVLLTSLRELDFDRETDKIAVEDYEKFRKRYEAEAVHIMRRLDEIHGGRDWQLKVDRQLTERLGHPPQISGVEVDAESDESPPSEESDASIDDQPPVPEAEEEEEEASESHEDEAQADEDEAQADEDEAQADEDEAQADQDEAAQVVDLDDVPQVRCGNCDALLASDDKFCSQCGTPVTPSEPDEPATSEASA